MTEKRELKRARGLFAGLVLTTFCAFGSLQAGSHPLYTHLAKITDQMPHKNELIVAYYGRPGVKTLGVLGKHSIGELKHMIRKRAAQYAKVTGKKVVPAFDIIYGLAAAAPGPRKDYIIYLSDKKLKPYIKAAEEEGFNLFIDLQLGKHTPQDAIRHVLKYLKYKNVHLAIDPEFEVKNLNVRPGKKIGHITGDWVNQTQQIMSDYMKKHGITEKKILLAHMFRHSMVSDKKGVRKYDNIKLIMNLDGHGSPRLKVNIYNGIYTKKNADKVAAGFKLFFKEDHPMMTPAQVMGLKPAQGRKVKYPPKYINYQ